MKKVVIGVLVLILLMGITIYITRQDQRSTMRKELTDFAIEDTASITRIVLKDESGNRVDLSRQGKGWKVNEAFDARPDAVEILLSTMKKLAVKAPISESMKSTVLKNIISSHTLVEAYDGGELLKTYFVGGPDKEHTGTFMMIKGSSRPFLMHIEGFHGFLTPRFFTNLNEWRHRKIFECKPEEIRSVSISYPENHAIDFSIERDDSGQLLVFTGEERSLRNDVDTFMLTAYLSRYKMIHFEGFEETKTESFVDSVMRSEPIFHISLTDMQGISTTVSGYKKPLSEGYDLEGSPITHDMDRLYLKINDQKIVVGQYAIFDKLTKGLGFLKDR